MMEMPPLPKPIAWVASQSLRWLADPARTKLARAETSLCLNDEGDQEPVYTASQMRAAILDERERCAKLCEDRAKTWSGDPPEDEASAWIRWEEEARNCAAAIRSES